MAGIARSTSAVLLLIATLVAAFAPPARVHALLPPFQYKLYLPLIALPPGPPRFTIINPTAGATVGGTSIVAAQPVIAASLTSVSFRAGSRDLGTDTTPNDGFQAFIDAALLPAGPLTITAVGQSPQGQTTQTVDVVVQPAPPASGTIGPQGGVLGTPSGGTIIIPPFAVKASTSVTVRDRTQDQVAAEAGIAWADSGLTFLGDIAMSASPPLLKPVGVTTRGFASRIQPGQTVVSYNLLPDQNGDGAGELVAANAALVAPNGALVSALASAATSVSQASGTAPQATPCQPAPGDGTAASRGFVGVLPVGGSLCGGVIGSGPVGIGVDPGRYSVRVYPPTGGRALSPFTGVSAESGYYYVPNIPQGIAFRAVALDTITGLTRTGDGVGPAVGESINLSFDFSRVEGQRFAIAIGDTVSDGAPAAGAGNLESAGAADTYVFSAEPDRQIVLDLLSTAPGLANTRWKLTTAAGTVVLNRKLGDTGVVTLPGAGTYRLTVGDDGGGGTGAYSFKLIGLPLPSRYAISLGDTVGPNAPAAGAGTIEQPFSKDSYSFTATAGQRVVFDLQNVAASLSGVTWRLNAPNGGVIFSRNLGFGGGVDPGVYTLLTTGTYTITVGDTNDPGTGTYGFQIRNAPTPQQFAIASGSTVANGAPAAGAGNIEEPYGQDRYTFTATAGQRAIFDLQNVAPSLDGLNWRLVAPDGTFVFNDSLSGGTSTYKLSAAGTYTLVVGSDISANTGTYGFGFQLKSAPAPQQFAITFGSTVSNGLPQAGAGNIEQIYSEDRYTFAAAVGQRVFIRVQSVDASLASTPFRLEAPDGHITLLGNLSFSQNSDTDIYTIVAAGTYTIVVGGDTDEGTGTYGFQLRSVPAPQQFAIAVGGTVSNGVPAVGAGNIEESYSQDLYTFAGVAGQRVIVAFQNVAPALNAVHWTIVPPVGASLDSRELGGGDATGYTLRATGAYTIAVGVETPPGTGTYELTLTNAPAPQQFALPSDGAVSDGVPGAGAGNIEAPFGQDRYTFAGQVGQQVLFELVNATVLNTVGWQLIAPGGSVVPSASDDTNSPVLYVLPTSGTYTIAVGTSGALDVGTYAFQMKSAPAPQQFSIAIGDTVSEGVPGPGAGNIEDPFGQDIYTFAGQTGQQLVITFQDSANTFSDVTLRLVSPDGITLFGGCNDCSMAIRTLPATGSYSIIVGRGPQSTTGTYGFQLALAPAPQEFAIAIGNTVSDGVPAAGAGNLELKLV